MSDQATLCGTGWVPWHDVRALLDGWDAAWSDLDGAHLGQVPLDMPAGTHLWAWRGDFWARVRIDEDEAVVGMLHPPGQCPRGDTCSGTVVTTTPASSASSWHEQHIRLPDVLRDTTWLVRHVHEGVGTAFVRQA